MKFSTFIRNKRLAKGMLVQALAKKAGVNASYVSLVEHGKKTPRITNAIRLCKALNVDVGELKKVTESFTKNGFLKTRA